MNILAIDTSTEACSAALLVNGKISDHHQIAPRHHADLILGMCDALLDDAGATLKELDALAFGRGPGAFTGVRIATGVIQGIAFAHQLPVVPVSSLAAMAFAAWQEKAVTHIMTAIDARMDEVYWACYTCSDQGVQEVVTEQVCRPENIILPENGTWSGLGTGWDTYQHVLTERAGELIGEIDGRVFPDAKAMVQLAAIAYQQGKTISAPEALPVYLRDNVAKKKAQQ